MENERNELKTQAIALEITKEDIAAAADAYADGCTADITGAHKEHFKAKVKMHWYAGWLAHSLMLEPYFANVMHASNTLATIAAAAKDFVEYIEEQLPEFDMPEYVALKNLLKD